MIGGVAAGPKAAAKARRCDPEMEIVLYQEEDDISYAGCGLPYYISGVIEEREDLISRTPGKFALEGIKILKNRRIEKIDIPNRAVSGRKIGSGETFTDHFDHAALIRLGPFAIHAARVELTRIRLLVDLLDDAINPAEA